MGLKIGGYQIFEKLGSGTSATAYLARDSRGRHAVAKRLHRPLATNPAIVERFLAAAEASGRIRIRKHVATVLVRRTSAEGVILMRQYVEGRPLADYVQTGRLSELDGNRLARDICDGLRAMASRDVVHGGIHPGNVIVGPDGRAKLTDFGTGLAYLTGKVLPTYPAEALRYLAPEQWRGEKGTTLSDVYSLGTVIALLDHAKPIFDGSGYAQLKAQVLAGRKVSCPVLAAALDANPARRYPTVDKLRSSLASRAGAARKPIPAQPKPERVARPKPVRPRSESPKPQPKPAKPQAATPRPQAAKPKPQAAKPKPQAAKPKPQAAKPKSQAAKPRPKPTNAKPESPARPAPGQAGWLSSLVDRVAGRDLLENVPPKPWIVPRNDCLQQRPLRAANGGPGDLTLLVSCVGKGVSASPDHLVIRPNRVSWIVVNVEPDSDTFSNLLFRWKQGKTEKRVVIKIVRTD
jgi:serine/threonine protein kinase